MHYTVLALVPETDPGGSRKTEERVREEAELLVEPYVYSEEYLFLAATGRLTPEVRAERPKARWDACGLDPMFAEQVAEADPSLRPRVTLFGPHGIATFRVRDIPYGPPFTSVVTPDGEHVCPWRHGPRMREEALERHEDCLAVAFTVHV